MPNGAAPVDDAELLAALRRGDEQAFATLIERHHTSMLRVARSYVATREAAEDVVQETWLGVINGLDRFEERSSLKTWLFRILVNRARTKGERESRSRPFSALDDADDEPAVAPSRFNPDGRWAGFWSAPPAAHLVPEDHVVLTETAARVSAVIDSLPEAQRTVITLRDVQGLGSDEVCALLGITDGNQRVILHRARSRCRALLERALVESPAEV